MNNWKEVFIWRTILAVIILVLFADSGSCQIVASNQLNSADPDVEWVRQLNSGFDSVASADVSGNVYVAGNGPSRIVLHKVSAVGDLIWSRNYGATVLDSANGVSADSLGNIYIGGFNGISIGNAFLAKYDQNGNIMWDRIIGTNKGSQINGVAADGQGNVYVAGNAREAIGGEYHGFDDAFVSKYDASGNRIWATQIGTTGTEGFWDIATDGLGNVYAAGGDSIANVLVTKFDSHGELVWSKTFGTDGFDYGQSVAADPLGNVYVAGITSGNLDGQNKGLNDVFVTKLDAAGNVHWSRQLGTSSNDEDGGVATDGVGNVFVNGYVNFAGHRDGFVAKFDAAGNGIWTLPMGNSLTGVSSDRQGSLYVTGGNSSGPFVAKIREIPEPATSALCGSALLLAAALTRPRR